MRWHALVIAWILAFLPVAGEQSSKLDEMLLQLDIAKSIFETRYAPGLWKKENRGWDLDLVYENTRQQLIDMGQPSLKQFQRLMRRFFHSCQDYHVDIFFYSTETASLPFKVIPVEGRLLLCQINRKILPSNLFTFEIGDELVLFDGNPAWDVLKNIVKDELGSGNPNTDTFLAAEILTQRNGMLGHNVPSGSIEIAFRSQRNNLVRRYFIPWTHSPDHVSRKGLDVKGQFAEGPLIDFLKQEMVLPQYAANTINSPAEPVKDPFSLGSKQSYLPKMGNVVWHAPDYFLFDAYLFESPDRRFIGYIRIPNYKGSTRHIEHFGLLIDFFQKNAEALVIDQLNNPGGSPVYLLALASMLTDKPLDTPKHKLSLSHHEAASAATMLPLLEKIENSQQAQQLIGSSIDGYPVNMDTVYNLKKYLSFIRDQWNAGKKLSDPVSLYGIEKVQPHPFFQFTKPIIVLVNSLDFSGGDFFPALMQDNRRAIIFGENTAGAGGMFSTYSHPNRFGIRSYHMTISIAERDNALTIENIGVKPDIICPLTTSDLRSNFETYKNKLLETLERIAHGRAAAYQ